MGVKRLGLDIGATHVRVAEVEFAGKKPFPGARGTLVGYSQQPLPPGAVQSGEVIDVGGVSAAIKAAVGRAKVSTKEVTVGVGAPNVVVRELEVPAMPMPQLRSSLPFQVQELLPMSPDEAMLDYYPTAQREADGSSLLRGILVAAPKSVVSQNLLAVENAGLRPTMVDLSAFALLRSQLTEEAGQRVVAFVDIGARITTVVIAQQGLPRMVRMMPSGGQDMTDSVAGALHSDSQRAEEVKRGLGIGANSVASEYAQAQESLAQAARTLFESIRNTFVFFSSNNPGVAIDSVVITGGGALLNGLGQYLASATRLPVRFGDTTSRITLGKKAEVTALQGNEAQAAVALGLTFGEV